MVIEGGGGSNHPVGLHGRLSLHDNNKSMMFKLNPYGSYYHLLSQGVSWEILRLAKDEMWIRTNFDDKEYEIHFNRVKS